MQLLGHICLKELTHVIRFTKISLLCMELRLISWFLTDCLVKNVGTPLWDKCEGEAHTPKSGKLESSETSENSELEFGGQNTLH
jgi:hypothetical protein